MSGPSGDGGVGAQRQSVINSRFARPVSHLFLLMAQKKKEKRKCENLLFLFKCVNYCPAPQSKVPLLYMPLILMAPSPPTL